MRFFPSIFFIKRTRKDKKNTYNFHALPRGTNEHVMSVSVAGHDHVQQTLKHLRVQRDIRHDTFPGNMAAGEDARIERHNQTWVYNNLKKIHKKKQHTVYVE